MLGADGVNCRCFKRNDSRTVRFVGNDGTESEMLAWFKHSDNLRTVVCPHFIHFNFSAGQNHQMSRFVTFTLDHFIFLEMKNRVGVFNEIPLVGCKNIPKSEHFIYGLHSCVLSFTHGMAEKLCLITMFYSTNLQQINLIKQKKVWIFEIIVT